MNENAGAGARHSKHDRLHEEVRSWYRTDVPALGYRVERRRFGVYRRNAGQPDSGLIIVESIQQNEVREFLADAGRYFDNRPVTIWIDNKELDATLGTALVAAGCATEQANVHLAHVGPPPQRTTVPGVTVEQVTPATLKDYALVKLKGFANREDQPQAERLEQELHIRERELAGIGRFTIARVGAEPAAVIGYYEGNDRLIFNLATRKPFRMSGIARNLLCRVIADSYDRACRSVIINTDPSDTPIRWYRRLGFTDEVYWRRSYLLEPSTIIRR